VYGIERATCNRLAKKQICPVLFAEARLRFRISSTLSCWIDRTLGCDHLAQQSIFLEQDSVKYSC
jgi:hypothetical protein